MCVCVVTVDCRDKILGILKPDTSDKILGNAVHLKLGMVCDVIRLYNEIVWGGLAQRFRCIAGRRHICTKRLLVCPTLLCVGYLAIERNRRESAFLHSRSPACGARKWGGGEEGGVWRRL